MKNSFDADRHVIQFDATKIPAGLSAIGPRDIVSVCVTKIDAHGREEARYAIPAQCVIVSSNSGDWSIDPIEGLVFDSVDEGDAEVLPC